MLPQQSLQSYRRTGKIRSTFGGEGIKMMGEAWERDWTYGSSSAKTVCLVLVLMLAARRRGGVQCIYCLLSKATDTC